MVWLQLEQLVLSYPPLFARKPWINIFLGQLELCLWLCGSLSSHSQEHFSILHFGTMSRLFTSSFTVLRADVPGGMDLQLLLSELLSLATPAQSSGATRCLGLAAFQTQISSERGRTVTHPSISPHLVGGQHPTKISPQGEMTMGARGTNPAGAQPSVAAVRCVCVNVCVDVWFLDVSDFSTHTSSSAHIYGKIAKDRLKPSLTSRNKSVWFLGIGHTGNLQGWVIQECHVLQDHSVGGAIKASFLYTLKSWLVGWALGASLTCLWHHEHT